MIKKLFLLFVLLVGSLSAMYEAVEIKKEDKTAKQSRVFEIKLFDKIFTVSEDVLKQFGLYEIQKDFEKRKDEKLEKKKKDDTKITWDVTEVISEIFPWIIKSKKTSNFLKLFEVLLNIASTKKIDSDFKKRRKMLYLIVKIAHVLDNKEVMRICIDEFIQGFGYIVFKSKEIVFFVNKKIIKAHAVVINGEEKFLSQDNYEILNLWNINGELEEDLKGVYSIEINGKKRLLYYSLDDNTFELNPPLMRKKIFEKQKKHSVLVNEKINTLLLSDNVIKLRNPKSGVEVVFKGHSDKVLGAKVVEINGEQKLLSWSDDNTVKRWSLNGALELDLKRHKGRIVIAKVVEINGEQKLFLLSSKGSYIYDFSFDRSFEHIDLIFRVLNGVPHRLDDKKSNDSKIFKTLPYFFQKKIKSKIKADEKKVGFFTGMFKDAKKSFSDFTNKFYKNKKELNIMELLYSLKEKFNPERVGKKNRHQFDLLSRIYKDESYIIETSGRDGKVYFSLPEKIIEAINLWKIVFPYRYELPLEQYELFLRIFLNKGHKIMLVGSSDQKIFNGMHKTIQRMINIELKEQKRLQKKMKN